MTDNHSDTRSRVRRSERAQRFYTARTFSDDEIISGEQPIIPHEETGHEAVSGSVSAAAVGVGVYAPNEPPASPEEAWEGYAPNETPAVGDAPVEAETGAEGEADFSAYYRRDGKATDGEEAEPAFAPPIKLDFSGYEDQPWNEAPQQEPQSNVYRPREATWADTARRDVLAADGVG